MFAFIFLTLVNPAWATVEGVIGIPLKQNANLVTPLPQTDDSEIFISRSQYIISYNKARRSPNWVAWSLDASQLGDSGRSKGFSEDQELEDFLSKSEGGFHAVQGYEYKQSCYERGHQIPSADRTHSSEDNRFVFMMSNMVPQTPYLNQIIWNHLEQYTRQLVSSERKKAFIIDGPIYDENFGKIGPDRDIPIPSKEYKIIYLLNSNQSPADIDPASPAIAVIMPNTQKQGNPQVPYESDCSDNPGDDGKDADDWKQYTASISEIESKSDLRFH